MPVLTADGLPWRRKQIALLRRDAHASLAGFVKAAWPILEPGVPLVWGWVHEAMCEHIQAWTLGEFSHLLIEVPPGSSKSTIASRCAPVWSWLSRRPDLSPTLRWMCASYGDLSNDLNTTRRDLIEDPKLRRLMGHKVRMMKGQRKKGLYKNTMRGSMMATTPGGAATGYHANKHMYDDLLKPEEAVEHGLERAARFLTKTMATRFRDQRKKSKCMVAQRLCPGDPNDVFFEMHPDAIRLTIPAEFVGERKCVTQWRGHRWEDPRKVEGESFEPIRFPKEQLRDHRDLRQLISESRIAGIEPPSFQLRAKTRRWEGGHEAVIAWSKEVAQWHQSNAEAESGECGGEASTAATDLRPSRPVPRRSATKKRSKRRRNGARSGHHDTPLRIPTSAR